MNKPEQAYLTVIDWPRGYDESMRIKALVGCAAMDPYTAKLASRRNLPGVMANIDASDRPHILNAMHAKGILCIAPTHDEIMNYPAPDVAIGVDQFPDADPARFVVESSVGEPWTFGADQVKLIVSGYIKFTTATVQTNYTTSVNAMSPSYAMAKALSSDQVHVNRNTKATDLLDLHIRMGPGSDSPLRLVRLLGPKARIGIVGDDARPSLLDDSRPREIAQILMPDAQIDTEFQDFDPPGNIRRLSQKHGGRAGSLTIDSWGFYSPWVGLIKQSMYGW